MLAAILNVLIWINLIAIVVIFAAMLIISYRVNKRDTITWEEYEEIKRQEKENKK